MATKTIESVLHENRVFPPSEAFVKQANISGMDAYRKLCAEAEKDLAGFWGRLAKEHVLWHKPFSQVLDETNNNPVRGDQAGTKRTQTTRLCPIIGNTEATPNHSYGNPYSPTWRDILASRCRVFGPV